MARVVFIMRRSGVVDVREFVECERSVERRFRRPRDIAVVILFELTHPGVPRLIPVAIPQAATARSHLQARVKNAHQKTMLKRLMKITDLPKLFLHPAFLYEFLEAAQLVC